MKTMNKALLLGLALVALLGAANAASFASVADAVKGLPELSTLAGLYDETTLASALADPGWVGTVFMPTNDAMSALEQQVGTDFATLMKGNPDQATAVFSYSIVPGKALLASALKDGTKLTTQSGQTLNVTTSGSTVYINGAPIVKSNVIAGQSIIHEIGGVLLPADLADMLGAASTGTDGSDPFAAYVTSDSTATTDGADTASATAVSASPSASDATVGSATADQAATADTAATAGTTTTTTTTSTTAVTAGRSGVPSTALGTAALALPALLALLL